MSDVGPPAPRDAPGAATGGDDGSTGETVVVEAGVEAGWESDDDDDDADIVVELSYVVEGREEEEDEDEDEEEEPEMKCDSCAVLHSVKPDASAGGCMVAAREEAVLSVMLAIGAE
jgi:hypothetical protein